MTQINLIESVRLLTGLRGHDLRAAGTMVGAMSPQKNRLSKWSQFVGWAANQIIFVLPAALKHTTFSRPVSQTPIWLAQPNWLADYPWAGQPQSGLPAEADVVVIGAGFTGAACAYHWARQNPAGGKMLVLEKGDPAAGASGACAGLVVMGRYYALVKKTVGQYLAQVRDDLSPAQREALAGQFAAIYARNAYKNAGNIERTITEEGFDCGYSRRGWIQAVDASNQAALDQAVAEGQSAGYADWSTLPPGEVAQKSGMHVQQPAAFSPGAACFDPARWVWCLLQAAIERPSVDLFTRTRVLEVTDDGEVYRLRTDRGTIRARHVINATESFTGKIHPECRDLIAPVQTQAAYADGGPEAMPPGLALSCARGFFLRPTDLAGVLFGSDETHLPYTQAGRNRPSRFITKFVLGEMAGYFGTSRQRVTHEWSSTAGFTVDQYPVVGLLDGKRQYIIGGMCGSGSGVSFNAALYVVQQILGQAANNDYPPEYFAPSRLLSPETHTWPAIEGTRNGGPREFS